MKAEIPLVPISGVVTANTTYVCFRRVSNKNLTAVQQVIIPFNTAVVSVPPASEPAFGSASPNA